MLLKRINENNLFVFLFIFYRKRNKYINDYFLWLV